MAWALNYFFPPKSHTEGSAELRAATPEEVKTYTKSKGWISRLDWWVNCVVNPIFFSFRTISQLVLRRSPDIGVVTFEHDFYCTKNPHVIKEALRFHRNDPERNDPEKGIFAHTTVINGMMAVMTKLFPKITSNDMILTCDPVHTKIYREFLRQFFSTKSIQPHLGDIQAIGSHFSSEWVKRGKPIILNQEIKLLASTVMAQIFLGHQEPCDKISAASSHITPWIGDALGMELSRLYRRITYYFPQMAFLSSFQKEETVKTMREAIQKSIVNAQSPESKPTLLKQMLQENFSMEQIQAMMVTLFVAGQDNVSTALIHSLLKLAQVPDLQEKIRQEGGDPMQSLLIRALICESLRMICPVAGIGRTLAKPALLTVTNKSGEVISKTLMKPGDEFQSMLVFAAQDPKLNPHPEKFDLSRHKDQDDYLPGLPHMPFGKGPNSCPAWYLYYAISAYVISHLANNYKLTTSFQGEPKTRIRFVTQITDTVAIELKKIV